MDRGCRLGSGRAPLRQQSYDAALYASVPYSAHNSENRRSPDRGGSGRRCAVSGERLIDDLRDFTDASTLLRLDEPSEV